MSTARDVPAGPTPSAVSAPRYRCQACGNLTRFDVVVASRTRSFHHYSIGGELTVESVDVLDERVEEVSCRWCGHGKAVEVIDASDASDGSDGCPVDPASGPTVFEGSP